MLTKLKEIYKTKLIDNVQSFSDDYYYFYKSKTKDQVFGIKKDISSNEYKLIKASFLEKQVFSNSPETQKIYDYLVEDAKYPFSSNKQIIISSNVSTEFTDLIQDLYKDTQYIELYGLNIFFITPNFDTKLEDIFNTIVYDLGKPMKIHQGMIINKNVSGSSVYSYLHIMKDFLYENNNNFSDIAAPFLKLKGEQRSELARIIYDVVITPLFSDSLFKDLLVTYFNNDLNVSKTAKSLYINRNSLLNKFEIVYKKTGIDLQKFSHACMMFLLVSE